MRSVGQRASKLLAVKVGGLKKKSAALAIPADLCASVFSIYRSIPPFNCVKSSRSWQHFKGPFCLVKFLRVYLVTVCSHLTMSVSLERKQIET